MKNTKQDPAIREIDAKAQELIQEFQNHVRACQATQEGHLDPRKIFEAWAIQKIAGLQYTVLHLAEKLNELGNQHHQN
ncbi:MAG: hypothetical protein L0Z50_24610 [Verrucomicrobiales bacterium]|nr:hypothetical protein [Verrucomicrobiales bacterium]